MTVSGWRTVHLADLVEVRHGFAFKGEFIRDNPPGDVLVTPGNFAIGGGFQQERPKYYDGPVQAEYVLQPGDLILTMTDLSRCGDTLGYPAIVPKGGNGRYLHNQRIGRVVIRDEGEVDREFLYYRLRARDYRHEILAGATGTTVRHTAPERILRFTFALPPLDEQRSIAGVLSALDDKIELNRRMNEALEAMERALFKGWFVDFAPVRAKAAGRRPYGMDDAAAALFPQAFEASELGEIPAGWGVACIGDSVRVVGGTTPRTDEPSFWDGGDICWATPKDLSRLTDQVLLDTERHITPEGLSQISSGLLPSGTVLLSSRAPIGYLALAEVPVSINQGFVAMVCDGNLPNQYVLRWCETNMDAIKARANGTTFLEVSKASFRPIPCLIPSAEVLRAFIQQVQPLHARLVCNLRESGTLAEMRDTLLPKLLSGEVRVKP